VFEAFVREALPPVLRPGQAVVMDNLAAHQVAAVRRLIENAGCRLIYLPTYSPDFSPIEPIGSKLKQTLRSITARTVRGLIDAVAEAFHTITPNDCIAYFRHCGYATNEMKVL
jgi:transposase